MKEFMYAQLAEYNQLQKNLDGLYHNISKKCGLSDSAFWILYCIRENGGSCAQKELYDSWFYSKQTVNSTIKQLEEKGILRLELALGSRKKKVVFLTQEGEMLAEKTVIPLMEAECRALNGFSDEEQKLFLELTRKYIALLRTETDRM